MTDAWRTMPENPMDDWCMDAHPIMVCERCGEGLARKPWAPDWDFIKLDGHEYDPDGDQACALCGTPGATVEALAYQY